MAAEKKVTKKQLLQEVKEKQSQIIKKMIRAAAILDFVTWIRDKGGEEQLTQYKNWSFRCRFTDTARSWGRINNQLIYDQIGTSGSLYKSNSPCNETMASKANSYVRKLLSLTNLRKIDDSVKVIDLTVIPTEEEIAWACYQFDEINIDYTEINLGKRKYMATYEGKLPATYSISFFAESQEEADSYAEFIRMSDCSSAMTRWQDKTYQTKLQAGQFSRLANKIEDIKILSVK